jgi:hypothetical protein
MGVKGTFHLLPTRAKVAVVVHCYDNTMHAYTRAYTQYIYRHRAKQGDQNRAKQTAKQRRRADPSLGKTIPA